MAFYIYKDRQGLWRWYLKSSNGNKIADSGESYTTKQNCLNGLQLVKASANASVYEI